MPADAAEVGAPGVTLMVQFGVPDPPGVHSFSYTRLLADHAFSVAEVAVFAAAIAPA